MSSHGVYDNTLEVVVLTNIRGIVSGGSADASVGEREEVEEEEGEWQPLELQDKCSKKWLWSILILHHPHKGAKVNRIYGVDYTIVGND